jgi:hypothetical protein
VASARRAGPFRGWLLFLCWAVAGACLTLMVSQVGAFTLPVGLVLVGLLYWQGRGTEALGFFEGAGMVIAFVGLINLDYHPCPGGTVVLKPGQTSFECGGFDGTPWLIVGAVLMVAAGLAFWRLRRSP